MFMVMMIVLHLKIQVLINGLIHLLFELFVLFQGFVEVISQLLLALKTNLELVLET